MALERAGRLVKIGLGNLALILSKGILAHMFSSASLHNINMQHVQFCVTKLTDNNKKLLKAERQTSFNTNITCPYQLTKDENIIILAGKELTLASS